VPINLIALFYLNPYKPKLKQFRSITTVHYIKIQIQTKDSLLKKETIHILITNQSFFQTFQQI